MNAAAVPVEAVDAVFEPRDLLRAMLGFTSQAMRDKVRQVVNHAVVTPVMHDAPVSPADEVLTVSFERVFTREEVTQILGELRSEEA